jgi:hypothetical protein
MTIPSRYGGGGRSHVQRFILAEELLAAGAPVAAHWVTERQIAPMLLETGSEEQRHRYLPGIARAEIAFCLGMSEPDSGSDLASVRTRAVPVEGGWAVTGQKIWTSNAHRAEFMLALCRTSPEDNHHAGLSQLIVDLHQPGVEIRPIPSAIGDDHFTEVFLDDVFVPDEQVMGAIGRGWHQVTTELGYERAGSDRFMSNVPLLCALIDRAPDRQDMNRPVGGLVAQLVALRAYSLQLMHAVEQGNSFAIDAALAKDAGGVFEQEMAEVIRAIGVPRRDAVLTSMLEGAVLSSPTATLRGGSTEILRGITARTLLKR